MGAVVACERGKLADLGERGRCHMQAVRDRAAAVSVQADDGAQLHASGAEQGRGSRSESHAMHPNTLPQNGRGRYRGFAGVDSRTILHDDCSAPHGPPLPLKYDRVMRTFAPTEAPPAPPLRDRSEIADRYKWSLSDIFPDWQAWEKAYEELTSRINAYAALQGTLAQGPDQLLAALRLADEVGQLTYKVWYYASLWYDQDQRDNQINARRQQVQILFAKATQASAWFNPELLNIPLATIQPWLAGSADLRVYRFAIEDLYRQQEHVLDDKGEHLLSLSSRFSSTPYDAYSALSTADVRHPTVRLSTGEVTLTY